jgi:hypothetical protein
METAMSEGDAVDGHNGTDVAMPSRIEMSLQE